MRRLFHFRQLVILIFAISFFYNGYSQQAESITTQNGLNGTKDGKNPVVYMTHDLTSDGLMAIYKAPGHKLPGKVAVKISTGEPGGNNFLFPDLIKDLVQSVNGTIVECNTAYGGPRSIR